MPRKDIGQAATNLDSSTTYIPERYRIGVEGAEWAAAAHSDAAERKFKRAMQKVLNEALRQAGLRDVSDSDWRNAAIEKGAGVIGSRISAALPKYREKFGPILDAMNRAAEASPEKTLDPMTNIDKRLKPVVKAAREAAGKE